MKTLDFRRRQRPLTLTDLLKAQQRQAKKGVREGKFLFTEAQKREFYELLCQQVQFKAEKAAVPRDPKRWAAWHIEVRA